MSKKKKKKKPLKKLAWLYFICFKIFRFLIHTPDQKKKRRRRKEKLNCCSNIYDGEFLLYFIRCAI